MTYFTHRMLLPYLQSSPHIPLQNHKQRSETGMVRHNRRVNGIEGDSKVTIIWIGKTPSFYHSYMHLNVKTAEFHNAFYFCISALHKIT